MIDGWVGVIAPGATDKFPNHIELDAINIDDVAASGSPEGARRIPLGLTSGINRTASLASRMLVACPADPEPDADHQTQKPHFLNDDSEFLNVLAAPGVIVVVLDAERSALHPDFNIYDSPRHATRIYGMK